MDGNWRHLSFKFGMEKRNVMKGLDEKCKNECASMRIGEKVRHMCSWRDAT